LFSYENFRYHRQHPRHRLRDGQGIPGGREGDWMLTGFSPRKQNLVLYIMCGFEPLKDVLSRLGKFDNGVSQ